MAGAAILAQTGAGICFLDRRDQLSGGDRRAAANARLAAHAVASQRRLWHEMKEGFSYSFHFSPIRAILLLCWRW